MNRRASGILMHVTSLPSPFGIGDLGPWAYRFADFLHQARQSYWQLLPLTPTDLRYDNSPYHGISAFAGNPLLLSPELLVHDGFLEQADLVETGELPSDGRVRYRDAIRLKERLFPKVFRNFMERKPAADYKRFCEENAWWLDDFALFSALKFRFKDQYWIDWPEEVRHRHPEAIASARAELAEQIEEARCLQFLFAGQWSRLQSYCGEKGIQIIGDIPIYLDYDSADVWSRPELYKLDHEKRQYVKAGVPPDYFSETGQLWGNPIYNWDFHREQGFDWWVKRFQRNLGMFDWVRIDHFRGLVAYWEVPAHEETAMNGQWVEAPVNDLFRALSRRIPKLPLIAEDLGVITPDVREVMRRFRLPGMKVLLFAFGWDMPTNPYIPHEMERRSIAYTGTHDNNTALGWFEYEASADDRERLFKYLGHEIPGNEISWELVRLAMASPANTAIIPMQDLLGLGQEARMNKPTTEEGNWRWRMTDDQITPELERSFREMTEIYGRI
ncbi:MAG: 4-alpha-glucanotransferase [Planctomycetota bacterium]|jgi:4-alpha-glucanotransferase